MTSVALGAPGAPPFPAKRSIISGFGLTALMWLLPFHIAVMALLFGGLHVREGIVRAIASWKEIAIGSLFVVTLLRVAIGKSRRSGVTGTDWAVASLLGVAVVFLLTENFWFQAKIPLGAELYGFRDSVFFMLLYFVGRATPEIAGDWKLLKRLYLVLLVTCVLAIIERVFVSPDTLVLLGVASYIQDFLGEAAFTVGNDFGLPENYWSLIGGRPFRRVGSVYLSSQGFAVPFLLMLPAATAFVFTRKGSSRRWALAGYALMWVALFLTVTRMTIVVCIIQTLLYAFLQRKPMAAVWSGIGLTTVVVTAIAIVPGMLGFVWQTLSWQSGSSQTHLADWSRGLVAIGTRPWGAGLGTSSAIATRFNLKPLTEDNQFLKYGVEMGIAGLVLHFTILVGVLVAGWRTFKEATTEATRFFGVVVALATIGIMLNAATSVVFNSMILSYLYFWLAGTAVTVSQDLRRRSAGSAEHSGTSGG